MATQTRTGADPDRTSGGAHDLEVARTHTDAAALVDKGARIVRDYSALHNRETVVLKQLADVIVRLRACYLNADGRPDLRGTSQEYRDAVQALYRKADVPPDAKSNMQAAVRYHIAQRLREYMREQGHTAEDFAYYRLDPDDAAERNKRRAREKTARARKAAELLADKTSRQPDLTALFDTAPGPRAADETAATRPEPEDAAALLLALSGRFRETAGDKPTLESLVRLKVDRRTELREELDALEAAAALVRSYL